MCMTASNAALPPSVVGLEVPEPDMTCVWARGLAIVEAPRRELLPFTTLVVLV